MPKTITVRIDDTVYDIFKKAAEGQKRTISNYIEYATLNYKKFGTTRKAAEFLHLSQPKLMRKKQKYSINFND